MNITYINQLDVQEAKWAKGSTSEYYIYPEANDYANKDFIFRISSATIDEIPAGFTNFSGYNRYLIMLNSSIDLEINNQRNIFNRHDLIKFNSLDIVTSHSKGKDYNLMVSNSITDCKIDIINGVITSNYNFVIGFALDDCNVLINNEDYQMKKFDCLVIKNIEKLNNHFICSNKLIIAQINL